MSGAHALRKVQPPRKQERTLRQWLSLTLSAALLILATAIAMLVIVLPAVTGGSALTVLTSSMAPKYPAGSLIVIQPTEPSDVSIGDVLTYQITSGKPDVISHRVIERRVDTETHEISFITQGDNNTVADPLPVQEVQVKGTLWYSLPGFGWINSAINGSARPFVVPIVAAALFAYGAWMLVATLRSRYRREHPRRGTWQRRRLLHHS